MTDTITVEVISALIEELACGQQARLLSYGRMLVPTLTDEDLLQPCDYPELETHPIFRYEEGVWAGIKTAQAAFLALMAERVEASSLEIS